MLYHTSTAFSNVQTHEDQDGINSSEDWKSQQYRTRIYHE